MPPGLQQGCFAQKLQQAVAVQGAPLHPASPPTSPEATARNQALWKTCPATTTPPMMQSESAKADPRPPRAPSAHEKPSARDPASPSSPRSPQGTSPPQPTRRPQTSRPPRSRRETPHHPAARHPAKPSSPPAAPPHLPALSPPQAPPRHPASAPRPPSPRNPPNPAMSTGLSTPHPKRPQ